MSGKFGVASVKSQGNVREFFLSCLYEPWRKGPVCSLELMEIATTLTPSSLGILPFVRTQYSLKDASSVTLGAMHSANLFIQRNAV